MPSVGEVLQQAWQVHQSGNVNAAMQLYRGVLRQFPRSAEAWVYLGIAQFDERDFDGSVKSYRKGIALKEHFPIAWNNLGNSLRMLGQVEEAERCFKKALMQQPNYLSALKNRGTLWVWNGDVERGLEWYTRGLEVDPDSAELHRNLGVISLLMGDYKKGFEEFRWRWRMPGLVRPAVAAAWQAAGIQVPVWSGEPLVGQTIVIYPEQGLGDAIHFIRVSAALKSSGANVIVVCQPDLIPLFRSVPGIDEIVAEVLPSSTGGDPVAAGMAMLQGSLTQANFQGSFLEILDGLHARDGEIFDGSNLFRSNSTASKHGYLRVPDVAIEFWKGWLAEHRNPARASRPLIGINWQGNREHHADVYRSVPLEEFRPLFEADQFQIVNMQFGHGVDQLDAADFASAVLRLPVSLDRTAGKFMDTAAVLCNLDALVTTDTAIAHLAGALGVRTHLLLGRVPDWRWLTEGDTTIWYPNTVISRQSELGQWREPVERIVQRLT